MALPPALAVAGAGTAAVVAFGLPSGILAGVAALPWLLLCVLMAGRGLVWLWGGRSLALNRLIPVTSLVYLAVGASWLTISRLGVAPLGLPSDIVELTGVHFHFAGFAAPLLALETGATLRARSPRLAALARLGGLGVIAAMPVVAAGFFIGQPVRAAGASLLATSLWVLAATMVPAAAALARVPARWLLLAALCVMGAMVLAVDYGAGPLLSVPTLSISQMAALHGTANALGFTGCATLAFALASRGETAAP